MPGIPTTCSCSARTRRRPIAWPGACADRRRTPGSAGCATGTSDPRVGHRGRRRRCGTGGHPVPPRGPGVRRQPHAQRWFRGIRALAPVSALAVTPAGLTFAEASTIPQAGAIALQGVRTAVAGSRVLINGAGGGSGTFAIQLCAHLGAHGTGVDNAAEQQFMHIVGQLAGAAIAVAMIMRGPAKAQGVALTHQKCARRGVGRPCVTGFGRAVSPGWWD